MNAKINLRSCFEILKIYFLFIVLILSLSSCVIVSTKGSTPSKQTVKKLSDLNGEYADLSEGKVGPRLSVILLGNSKPNTDRIRVFAKDDKTLVLTLLQGDKELSTNEINLFKKFKKDGRSLIVFQHSGSGQDGQNYALIGVTGHRFQSGELYIASNGDVIYHESASGAGVAQLSWVMIPFAGYVSDAYTYKKLK